VHSAAILAGLARRSVPPEAGGPALAIEGPVSVPSGRSYPHSPKSLKATSPKR